MMSCARVIVTAAPACMDHAEALCRDLNNADFGERPDLDGPRFDAIVAAQCDAAALGDAGAAVVITEQLDDAALLRQLTRALEAADVPTIAVDSGTSPRRDGLSTVRPCRLPHDAPPHLIRGVALGLAHQQHAVDELRAEATLARRYHGGLEGEIAKIHEELQLAAMIQREYLPRSLPELHGITFAAMWRPTSYVSGDIYDVMRLDEDHVGVFIADAVGHGVPAALLTMIITRSLQTKEVGQSTYRLVDPGEVLARLNEQMIKCRGRTTRFATAVYAVINCRTRTVRLALAGHPAPIVIGHSGAMRTIDAEGGLLGVFDEECYEAVNFELAVGDRLLLYSDGFEQAFPDAGEQGVDRASNLNQYLSVFEQLGACRTPTDLIKGMEQMLDGQLGSLHQADDLTLLCAGAGTVGQRSEQACAADVADSHVSQAPVDRAA